MAERALPENIHFEIEFVQFGGFFMRKVVLRTEIFAKSKALKICIFSESMRMEGSPCYIFAWS